MKAEQNTSLPAIANDDDGLATPGTIYSRLLAAMIVIAALLATAPSAALAAITYFASASNPTDGNSLDLTTVPVIPPGSMLAGDLVILVANSREAGNTLTISATGGQAWTSQTANTTNASSRIFWARYNGTWSANPSVSFPGTANGTTVAMHVFRPSSGSNTWALDVAQTNGSFGAPGGSHDVTIGGITTVTGGALVFASWISTDNNTWAVQTAGWANAGSAQYRNGDGNDASQSSAYKVMPTAGASGNVTNRQTALGGDAGNTSIVAFKEVLPAPTVAKSFTAASIGINSTSTLTITITNPSTATINGLAFTDTYPSTNLKNAATPALTNTCGGAATATAGASALSLSGGTLAGSSSCSVTVSVTSAIAASYVNSTGAVTSTNASSGTAATATLTVTAMTCFTDNFNRADGAPAGNWVVANESGTFGNPKIVSNRLRLTDATNSVSTMAALQQLFPAAGNKIVVEFDHFAYNGNGADGIGVVLSDASVAPVPGAFGGSLGYAQKQVSAGGDTTHPGFAGGWIGLALDEYGNFSANTEGRSGGTAPGLRIDSVAIRGSGSAYTGYPYHRGTATLTPGVDLAGATPAPGYRYRITIDHTNGVNAFTSVERDTGSGYTSLIAAYDAKAEAGQAAVPTNWYLSFTGSTGGSTNVHEIDNLQVCSTNPQPLPALDHLRLLHDTAALTCAAETVTVKACADAACDTLYLGSVTADLTNIAGATWSSDPVTFTGGQTSVTLTKTTAGAVTLGAVAVPAVNTTRCFNGATETCTLTYTASAACFDTAETGANPSTPIFTKLAGTAFTLDVLATAGGVVNSSYIGTIAVDLVDPTAGSGNCSDTNAGLTAAVNYSFTSVNAGRRTYSFNYPYAAANVKVRIRDTAANQPACSADNFAIRPLQFALTTTSALNPASNTLTAGANFNLTANPGTAVTQGYTGTPVVDATGIVDHNTAAIAAAAWAGNFTPIAAPGGGSLAGNFQYHDVGTITLNADAVRDANFTAVDQITGIVGGVDHGANGDCVAGSTTNTIASGKYGCRVGSTALGPLGRFRPDHFSLSGGSINTRSTAACAPASTFTYMAEPMQLVFTLTAQSAAPTSRTTKNYVGTWAKLDPTDLLLWPNGKLGLSPSIALGAIDAAAPTQLSARMSVSAVAATGWAVAGSEGSNTITATATMTRGAAPDGPYASVTLGIDPRDSDGVRFTAYDLDANNDATNERRQVGAATSYRYGRLHLLNAYGSELLPLRVPVRAEYFTGTGWALNAADGCTSLPADAFALSGGIAANTSASAVALTAGNGTLTLAMPSPIAVGSVDVAANLGATGTTADVSCNTTNPPSTAGNMSWLQFPWCTGKLDPNARIKFGSPKAPYIYLRERY